MTIKTYIAIFLRALSKFFPLLSDIANIRHIVAQPPFLFNLRSFEQKIVLALV